MFQSRTPVRTLTALVGLVLTLVLGTAVAQGAETAPGYEEWSACPTKAENPNIVTCIRTDITGGHFAMGNKDVPISKPMVLSGGINNGGSEFDGELAPVKQKVPGGVVGLTGLTWLLELFGSEALTLYAVTELAGAPKLLNEPIQLPIKVHLVNPLLGSKCYIGSDSNPIQLNLTYGTTNPPPPNEPISGTFPEQVLNQPPGSIRANNGTLVDNSFAAPGSNGCQLVLFGFIPVGIDGLVNSASGLPSAAGTNETTQDVDLSFVSRNVVYP